MILFLAANLSGGATVQGSYSLFGFSSPRANIKTFTLFNTVKDMWTAGVYPLSILIAVLSGIWP
jgi:hypothetical protein